MRHDRKHSRKRVTTEAGVTRKTTTTVDDKGTTTTSVEETEPILKAETTEDDASR